MPETPVTFTYLQRALEEGSAQLIGEVGSERVEYGMAIEGNPARGKQGKRATSSPY